MMATVTDLPRQGTRTASRKCVEALLDKAGIQIDGPHPWDLRVNDPRLFQRVIAKQSLGLGEAYMDEWWDCERLDEFFFRILRAGCDELGIPKDPALVWAYLRARLFNLQNRRRAFQVGEQHYDLGNDLYEAMLDPRLTYSCGYWRKATDLTAAQEAKLDLVCRKLKLAPGMTVLDIGCGWGSFAGFAAERYGAEVTGVTVSREQAAYVRERYKDLPVQVALQDYRAVTGKYDRVVSIGMFEHVGRKNYNTYFDAVRRLLKDGGLTLLHTIGRNTSERFGGSDPWMEKYIFPNGELPSMREITAASEDQFVEEDWHNIGPDYDKTLMAWHHNFTTNWSQLEVRYGRPFYRMWVYYLQCCAGMFRARRLQVWQIVFSKRGLPGGYVPVR